MNEPDDWVRRRIDSHDERIGTLEEEQVRVRRRLHDLESDRHATRLLATTVGQLAERIQQMADGVDAIAERAVEAVLGNRAARRREGWQHRLALASTGVGLGSALGAVITHLLS